MTRFPCTLRPTLPFATPRLLVAVPLVLLMAISGLPACSGEDSSSEGPPPGDQGADAGSRDRGFDTSDAGSDWDSEIDGDMSDLSDMDPEDGSETDDVDAIDAADLTDLSEDAPTWRDADSDLDVSDAHADGGDATDGTDGTDGDVVEPTLCVVPTPGFDPEAVCGSWHEGGIIINSEDDDDWDALLDAQCIDGGVVIESGAATGVLDLSHLLYIDGNLLIHSNYGLTGIDLSGLVALGGDLSLRTMVSLTDLDLSQLELIGGGVTIRTLPSIGVLELPALLAIKGRVEIGTVDRREAFVGISAPRLHSIGSTTLWGSRPTTVDLPALRSVTSGYGSLFLYTRDDAFDDCFATCTRPGPYDDCFATCGATSALNLPNLCAVAHLTIDFDDMVAIEVDLSSLKSATSLKVSSGSFGGIRSLAVPVLAEVEESFRVYSYNNVPGSAATLEAPLLTSVGDVWSTMPSGATLHLRALESAEDVRLNQRATSGLVADICDPGECPVTGFEVPGPTTLRNLTVNCDRCDVDLSALESVTGALQLTGDANLTLPALGSVYWLFADHADVSVFDDLGDAALSIVLIEHPRGGSSLSLDEVTGVESIRFVQNATGEVTSLAFPVLEDIITLDIGGSTLESLSLPNLVELDELSLQNLTSLETLTVPKLESVGDLSVSNAGSAAIEFPELTWVGELRVSHNYASLPSFPVLADVDLAYIGNNTEALSLPALVTAGDLYLQWDEVPTVTVPVLEQVDRLDFDQNSNGIIPLSAFPSLQRVNEYLILDDTRLDELHMGASYIRTTYARRSVMSEIDLPAVSEVAAFTLQDNQHLTTVNLPVLETTTWFTIENNPLLSSCDMVALAQDLFTPPPGSGSYCVSENEDDCADDCP